MFFLFEAQVFLCGQTETHKHAHTDTHTHSSAQPVDRGPMPAVCRTCSHRVAPSRARRQDERPAPASRPCKRTASCKVGCRYFCWQHAAHHVAAKKAQRKNRAVKSCFDDDGGAYNMCESFNLYAKEASVLLGSVHASKFHDATYSREYTTIALLLGVVTRLLTGKLGLASKLGSRVHKLGALAQKTLAATLKDERGREDSEDVYVRLAAGWANAAEGGGKEAEEKQKIGLGDAAAARARLEQRPTKTTGQKVLAEYTADLCFLWALGVYGKTHPRDTTYSRKDADHQLELARGHALALLASDSDVLKGTLSFTQSVLTNMKSRNRVYLATHAVYVLSDYGTAPCLGDPTSWHATFVKWYDALTATKQRLARNRELLYEIMICLVVAHASSPHGECALPGSLVETLQKFAASKRATLVSSGTLTAYYPYHQAGMDRGFEAMHSHLTALHLTATLVSACTRG